jgi:hypothetical protein
MHEKNPATILASTALWWEEVWEASQIYTSNSPLASKAKTESDYMSYPVIPR